MTLSTALLRASLRRLLAALRAFLLIPAPGLDFAFEHSELAQLHASTNVSSGASVDAQTWRDLLIERYASMLSTGVSIFGQQMLHRRLRAGLDAAACTEHSASIKALMADPEQLQRLDQACQPLRGAGIEIAALLFGAPVAVDRPAWTRCAGIVGAGFLVSVAATFAWPLAWAGVGIGFAALVAIRFRYSARIEGWHLSMASLQTLLAVCGILGARGEPLAHRFAALRGRVGQIHRGLSRAPLVMAIPGVKEYLDWFMLADVRHYFKSTARVEGHRLFLRECYLLTANLEADIALARHLRASPTFCWAERHAGKDLALVEVVHPLMAQAAPLSIALAGKGAFISGQNGVGKSTLLRTIGLNIVVARAFGFCYARSAFVSTLPVYASMQNEDSLLGAESLYIAELRRAREMLASLDGPHHGTYIIDEVFRGTNHVESVAAAAAVLDELASKGMVIVSSHNLVLAPLLQHRLTPWYVSAPDGDARRLVLLPGVLAQTNGIALLSERGFDARVQQRASAVFTWLNGYLAHPDPCAHIVLATPA